MMALSPVKWEHEELCCLCVGCVSDILNLSDSGVLHREVLDNVAVLPKNNWLKYISFIMCTTGEFLIL
jgi:hypothetical protein